MLILDALHNNGFSCFICGGACRDLILGKTPKDYDVTTSALPEQVMEVFKGYEVIPTGLQHGTVTVVIHNEPIEVTTYRIEDGYSDNRHPDRITFACSIEDDLMRRDFRMNAIAYNPWNGLADPFNGINDIKNKTVCCVGKAENRFNEDGLRILRALRFAAQLDFEIEENTSKAIHDCKHLLDNISKERIQGELVKILMSNNGGKVFGEYRDVLCQIIPEVEDMSGFKHTGNCYIYENALEHTLRCLDSYGLDFDTDEDWNDIVLRLALLLHDIGKPHCPENHADASADMAYAILKDLRFSNDVVKDTVQLIRYHCFNFDGDVHPTVNVKKLLNEIGETQFRRLIMLQKCHLSNQLLQLTDKRKRDFLLMTEEYLDEILENDECYSLKQLAVNGDDLIERGVPQGKKVGEVLNILLEMVIVGNVGNDREELLDMADEIIGG